jgi:hypothetical protein
MSVFVDSKGDTFPCRRYVPMNKTEELIEEAEAHGAEVIDWRFQTDRIKGLYCDGVIAMSKDIDTSAEKTCILAEELGHHLTASGDILDQNVTANRKQELRGRIWAYNRLIGLTGIIKAYRSGCRNRYEMAELLEVPEDVLQDAIDYYQSRYGLFTQLDNYVIYFEPLGVMELV